MWEKVVELAMSDGLWALLFCVLLIFELKDSRAREKKYQNTITNLSQDLGYMNTMNERSRGPPLPATRLSSRRFVVLIASFPAANECQCCTRCRAGQPPLMPHGRRSEGVATRVPPDPATRHPAGNFSPPIFGYGSRPPRR